MQRKEITLVGFLVVLAVVYVIFFTDSFRKPTLLITPSSRPERGVQAGMVLPVFFNMSRSCELTSVKVVPLDGTNFDAHAAPIWYMVAKTNIPATKLLQYGVPIRGMKPMIPQARPEPLEANKVYRMIVQAGDLNGYADFRPLVMPSQR